MHSEIGFPGKNWRRNSVLGYKTMSTKIVPRILGIVPVSLRRAMIGAEDNPSWIANFFHRWLNRIPVGREEVFDCKGDLEGFRMVTEWQRYRAFLYGNWEPEVSRVVRAEAKKGMTVLDVGGHIGYYTLLLAKCVGKSGRVFTFEPSPKNFELLDKNIRLNHLTQVEAFPLAVFSSKGISTITIPDGDCNSGGASVVSQVGTREIQVETITMDGFCAERNIRPEFIKMDVEGAEYDVLLGAEQTVRSCLPKMLVEVHHFDRNPNGNPVPRLLKRWGYEITWIERLELTSYLFAVACANQLGFPLDS